jgi:EmrB/QacA subfamily drug resistance transporter
MRDPVPFAATHRNQLLPMVVSLPLLLQNLDSSVIAIALPAMADSLQVDPLSLNLAITAYLISLAIFLPAAGWLADRFGPRAVFCSAIGVFSTASAVCGLATSLEMLVACRVVQGLGGAMMVPVGRLLLLRNVAPAAMLSAMVWFTVPPAFGRMLGPLLGGMLVAWASWRWIFAVNVVIGLVAIALALTIIEPGEPPQERPAFDATGFLLLGVGVASLLAGLEGAGSRLFGSGAASWAMALSGAACLAAYGLHHRRSAQPIIDLRMLRLRTFFAAIVGGLPLRLAIGAVPFLLPLLLQLGFGLSALQAGLLMVATALGSLATRVLMAATIRRVGFRALLLAATLGASASYLVYGTFTPDTPQPLVFAALLVGGLMVSMVMVSMQTLAFSEIPQPLMGQATALSTMAQQLSVSLGVSLAVELLRLSVWARGGDPAVLLATDFPPAFFIVAAIVLVALFAFRRLPADVGAELREQR